MRTTKVLTIRRFFQPGLASTFAIRNQSGLFINFISFIKPLIQPAFYILKMHMPFTIGAYFQLHFRQFYHGSILYGP